MNFDHEKDHGKKMERVGLPSSDPQEDSIGNHVPGKHPVIDLFKPSMRLMKTSLFWVHDEFGNEQVIPIYNISYF